MKEQPKNRTTTQKKAQDKKGASRGRKGKRKRSRAFMRFKLAVQILILLFLLTLLILGVVFYIKYGNKILKIQQEAKQIISQSDLDSFRQSETSLVYGSKGNLLSVLKGEKDVYYIYYEDIPDEVVDAMISIEDKKFNSHKGVDIKANIRAVAALIKHKGEITQGASTITQQLCRNIYLTHEVSWERKVKEMFLAIELEKKYDKFQIMEFYLNNVYFSNGYYGIQAASKGYFSKDVGELSLSQIGFLCAIPNNPTLYDPVEHPENTLKRRNRILKQMLEDGKISRADYNEALNEEIELEQSSVSKKNYIDTYVNYCAARALMEQQGFVFRNEFKDEEDKEAYQDLYSEYYNQCQQSLYSGGYRIYTAIDTQKQKKLQTAVNEELKGFKEKNKEKIYKLQGAAVCIDNSTGKVVAIVGGRGQKTSGYTLNRAYQSYRQPGSSIKPLIVYTPLFEQGYLPSTLVEDKKTEEGPKNSDGAYEGKITVRRAVEKSKNTTAWSLFEELTPKKGLSYLLDMEFNKIDDNDYYPAAALGGFTIGCSPVEMTSAFAALANDGIFREPTCIIKILDSKGEVVVPEAGKEKRVYETNASRMMTDVLIGVMNNGTGRNVSIHNMPCAGKTGTTDDKKDGWFVGYTPYYTTGVWVGYDIPKSLSDLAGGTYPGRIWKTYMEWLHEDLDERVFPAYEGKMEEEKAKKEEKKPVVKNTPEPTPTEEPEPTEEPVETEAPQDGLSDEETDFGDPADYEGEPFEEEGMEENTEGGSSGEGLPVDDSLPVEGEATLPPDENQTIPQGGDNQWEGEIPEVQGGQEDDIMAPESSGISNEINQ